ncbi:hypothetical protein M408DRAFT_60505, partial [Serendipita vermifera MAFF 305830]
LSTMSSPSTAHRAGPSRKSLSAVVSTSKHHAAHRKRAKSMASSNPEELTPRSKRRRSLVPKKSILKQSNAGASLSTINPLASSQIEQSRSQQPLEDITLNFTRVSGFNQDRRVSFAPNAHVRLIPKESQQSNNSSSPPSSPADESIDSPNTSQENTRSAPDSSPIKNDRNTRRSSLRQSMGDGEGEQSMDLASDTSYLDEQSVDSAEEQPSPQKRRESGISEGSSMDIDDSQVDMDMTMNTNVSGRPSLARPRRSSTRPPRRESTAPRETDANMSLTEYTVGLGVSLMPEKEASAHWLALKAVMNHSEEPSSPPADIDIESAAARLLFAGHDIPVPPQDDGDTTISSEGGESSGSGDGKTMDLTSLTGGLRRASMRDATASFPRGSLKDITTSLPRASFGPSAPSTEESSISPEESTAPPAPAAKPSSLPVPASTGPSIFRAKAASFVPTPRAAPSSPTKVAESSPVKSTQRPKTPVFSAAFAPRSPAKPKTAFTTPVKRSHPVDESSAAVESPNKKLIVAGEGGAKTQAIPKPTPSKVAPSPSAKKAPFVARRPSDFLARPSMSRASLPLRQPPPAPSAPLSPERLVATPSSGTPAKVLSPQKEATPRKEVIQPPKSPRFAPSPKVLTPIVECEREASLQQEAELRIASSPRRNSSPVRTPTARRSFAPTPVAVSPWLSRTARSSVAPSLYEEGENTGDYASEENMLDLLSEETRARLPGSVDELLRAVGGEFMDNVAVRRRSTMALRAKEEYPDSPIVPADYAIAVAVDYPLLAYHDYVVNHLTAQIDELDIKQSETDQFVKTNPPAIFIDYAEGGPEQLPDLKATLETVRAMVRLRTKIQWYQWRFKDISNLLREVGERENDALQDLSKTQQSIAGLTPALDILEVQHAEIMAELERERAAVEEIEKCDPKELAEVKSSIADNATQLSMLEEEMADIQKETDGSEKRIRDYQAEQKALEQKIESANQMVLSTMPGRNIRAETKREIDLIERLSRWKATRLTPSRVELEYAQHILVSIPCNNWTPILESCDIRLRTVHSLSKPRQDWLPLFTTFSVDAARERLINGRFGKKSVGKIMEKLSTFWTCCDVVRHEIMMLRTKYAVKLRYDSQHTKALTVEVPILFEKSAAKVIAEFDINAKTVQTWPLTVPDIQARLNLAYALDDNVTIDTDPLLAALRDRLQQATIAENFGVLLEACVEVDALYP